MVGAKLLKTALSAAAGLFLLTSCWLLAPQPFPDYIAGTVLRIDVSPQINAVLKTAVSARYEISCVSTPAGERVLLLIDPIVANPTADSPTPRLLIFDQSLGYLGEVVPQSPLGYVGRPYLLAADGNILSGDTLFDPNTGTVARTLSPSGLTGFGFATSGTAPMTYVLSLPPGESSSTSLVLSGYDALWSAPVNYTLNIVDPTPVANVGYTLEGARLENDGNTITVVVLDTAKSQFSVVQSSISSIVAGSPPSLLTGATPNNISGTNGVAYLTRNDFIVRRTTGSFERYTADGKTMTSSITSDRRAGIVYGFSTDGKYLYRLDPVTGMFSLIRTWW